MQFLARIKFPKAVIMGDLMPEIFSIRAGMPIGNEGDGFNRGPPEIRRNFVPELFVAA